MTTQLYLVVDSKADIFMDSPLPYTTWTVDRRIDPITFEVCRTYITKDFPSVVPGSNVMEVNPSKPLYLVTVKSNTVEDVWETLEQIHDSCFLSSSMTRNSWYPSVDNNYHHTTRLAVNSEDDMAFITLMLVVEKVEKI